MTPVYIGAPEIALDLVGYLPDAPAGSGSIVRYAVTAEVDAVVRIGTPLPPADIPHVVCRRIKVIGRSGQIIPRAYLIESGLSYLRRIKGFVPHPEAP